VAFDLGADSDVVTREIRIAEINTAAAAGELSQPTWCVHEPPEDETVGAFDLTLELVPALGIRVGAQYPPGGGPFDELEPQLQIEVVKSGRRIRPLMDCEPLAAYYQGSILFIGESRIGCGDGRGLHFKPTEVPLVVLRLQAAVIRQSEFVFPVVVRVGPPV